MCVQRNDMVLQHGRPDWLLVHVKSFYGVDFVT